MNLKMLKSLKKQSFIGPGRSKSIGTVETVLPYNKAYNFLEKDPVYLLRLCQSLNWKSIEKCCRIMNEAFSTSFEQFSSHARNQLLQRDDWGNTPLHIVCYHKPPPSVVEALLMVAASSTTSAAFTPSAAERTRTSIPSSVENLLLTVNYYGTTPLLVACKSGACRKIINMLLHGKAVTMCDDEGLSPFTALLNRYMMLQKVPMLRNRWTRLDDIQIEDLFQRHQHHPCHGGDSCLMDSNDNFSLGPVQLLSYSSVVLEKNELLLDGIFELPFDKETIGTTTTTITTSSSSSAVQDIFPLFWKIIDDLVQCAWKREVPGDIKFISYLHGAALIADVLPQEIADMIFRLYTTTNNKAPQQQQDMMRSNDGYSPGQKQQRFFAHTQRSGEKNTYFANSSIVSPLHFALLRQISSNSLLRQQHACFIRRLVEMEATTTATISTPIACWFPTHGMHPSNTLQNSSKEKYVCASSVSQCSYKKETRKPPLPAFLLCQSITSGNYWHLKDGTEGPVQSIAKMNPNDLSKQDPVSGLYPFMLAALATATSTTTTVTSSSSAISGDVPKRTKTLQFLLDGCCYNNKNNSARDDNNLRVDTIYNLLLAAPECIQLGNERLL